MKGIYLIINHHFDFNEEEILGISSQLNSLKYLPLCLVTSKGNGLSIFLDKFKQQLDELELNKERISIEYFDEKYFNSIQGYNELLCSIEFYQRFNEYDFIVVSQPDVFLMDYKKFLNLPQMMERYDYIGAPWLDDVLTSPSLKKMRKVFFFKAFLSDVNRYLFFLFKRGLLELFPDIDFLYLSGNGGFSIRKTQVMLNYLKSLSEKDWAKIHSFRQESNTKLDSNVFAEDVFWCLFPSVLNKQIRVAPPSFSVHYAWEQGDLNTLLYYSNNNPPLAIHAWMKLKLKDYVLENRKPHSSFK